MARAVLFHRIGALPVKKLIFTPAAQVMLAVALVLCTLGIYFPAIHGTLLWDDEGHITAAALRSLHGLVRIWTEVGATQQYYPLLHSAFWFEHRLWGDAVLGYHLINILEHAASAFLVFAIVRRLQLPGAVLAAFIFAVHPVGVESVAWISEQKNTLSGLFYLGAFFVYLGFDETRRWPDYILASAFFIAALLSKAVTATLPAVLLCLFWWRHGQLRLRRDVAPLLLWLFIGLAAGSFSAFVERKFIGAHGTDFNFSIAQRGLLSGRVLWFYVSKAIWPINQDFIYPRWTTEEISHGLPYLLGALLVAALALIYSRKNRAPLAVILIYAGTLFPVLGFVNVYPFLFSYVADHFQYLALLALIIPFSAVLGKMIAHAEGGGRFFARGFAVLLCFALGLRSWSLAHQYRDSITLYQSVLRGNPDCWMAHNNLANIYSRSPATLREAISEYNLALAQKPDRAETHFDLANAWVKIPGQLPAAIAQYKIAVELQPQFADAYNNLGKALASLAGSNDEAGEAFDHAIALNPRLAEAQANLGTWFSKKPGRLTDAIAHYRLAIEIDPDSAALHFNLGVVLGQTTGHRDEAVAEYQRAIQLQPDFADAHFNLANLLVLDPARKSEAIEHYRTTLRLEPDRIAVEEILKRLESSAAP